MENFVDISDIKCLKSDLIAELSDIFEIKRCNRQIFGFTITFKDHKIINIIKEFTESNREEKESEVHFLHNRILKLIEKVKDEPK